MLQERQFPLFHGHDHLPCVASLTATDVEQQYTAELLSMMSVEAGVNDVRTSESPIVRMRHPDAPRFYQRGEGCSADHVEEHSEPDYWSKRESQIIVRAI